VIADNAQTAQVPGELFELRLPYIDLPVAEQRINVIAIWKRCSRLDKGGFSILAYFGYVNRTGGALLMMAMACLYFVICLISAASISGRPTSVVRFESSLLPACTSDKLDCSTVVVPSLREAYKEGSKGNYVFESRKKAGQPILDPKKAFNSALKDAGIGNFRFHDLRHTAGTRLAEAGADAFTIKDILGHASIQTSAIYVHTTDEGKRRALSALGRYVEIHGHKLGTNEKEQIE
jgi:hypothetical protein